MDFPGNSGSFQSSGGGVLFGGDEGYEYSSNPTRLQINPQTQLFDSSSSSDGGGYRLEAFPRSPPPSCGPSCTDVVGRSGCSSAATDASSTMGSASSSTRLGQLTAGTQRGSKKRARASRQAPTTVLTTDTSNFRQLVQEFTGIPESPFSMFSTFPRSRFDPFRAAPGIGSGLPTHKAPSAHLLRPFARKILATTSGPFGSASVSTTVPPDPGTYNMSTNNPHVATSRMAPPAPPNTTTPPLGYVVARSDSCNFLPTGSPTLDFQPMLQYSALPPQKPNVPAVEDGACCTTDLAASDAWRRCVGGGVDGGLLELIHGSGGNGENFRSIDNVCLRPESDPMALPEDGSSQENLDCSWIFSSN